MGRSHNISLSGPIRIQEKWLTLVFTEQPKYLVIFAKNAHLTRVPAPPLPRLSLALSGLFSFVFEVRHHFALDFGSPLSKQRPDHFLLGIVCPFSDVGVTYAALIVQNNYGRPGVDAVGIPGFHFVVGYDGINDVVLL